MPPTLTCGEHTCGGHTCGEQNAHRVFFFPVSRTPAAAPGKSRTVSLSSPRLARTRLVPGVGPHRAPVFPGREKARGCAEQFAHRVCACAQPRTHARLRRASRAPCLCLCPAAHARAPAVGNSRTGFVAAFGPRTTAVLSGCKPMPGSCFPGQAGILSPVPCGREETRRAKAPARPQRTETPEKLSSAPWLFGRFPYLPAVCGPKGR